MVIVFLSGCAEIDLCSTFGICGDTAQVSVSKEQTGPKDIITITGKETYPRSPIPPDQHVTFLIGLKNNDDQIDRAAKNVFLELYDAPVFKTSSGDVACNLAGACQPDQCNKKGKCTILPGEEKTLTIDMKSPSEAEIADVRTKPELAFSVNYDFSSSTLFDVVVVDPVEIFEMQKAGKSLPLKQSIIFSSGPVKVDGELRGEQYGLSKRSATLVFTVKDEGSGNLPAVKKGKLKIKFPNGLVFDKDRIKGPMVPGSVSSEGDGGEGKPIVIDSEYVYSSKYNLFELDPDLNFYDMDNAPKTTHELGEGHEWEYIVVFDDEEETVRRKLEHAPVYLGKLKELFGEPSLGRHTLYIKWQATDGKWYQTKKSTITITDDMIKSGTPFIYTRSSGGKWTYDTKIIYKLDRKDKETTQERILDRFDGSLQIREDEDEIAYIDYLYVKVWDEKGVVHLLRSDNWLLRYDDGDYLVMEKGDVVQLDFDMDFEVVQASVVAKGYYIPVKAENIITGMVTENFKCNFESKIVKGQNFEITCNEKGNNVNVVLQKGKMGEYFARFSLGDGDKFTIKKDDKPSLSSTGGFLGTGSPIDKFEDMELGEYEIKIREGKTIRYSSNVKIAEAIEDGEPEMSEPSVNKPAETDDSKCSECGKGITRCDADECHKLGNCYATPVAGGVSYKCHSCKEIPESNLKCGYFEDASECRTGACGLSCRWDGTKCVEGGRIDAELIEEKITFTCKDVENYVVCTNNDEIKMFKDESVPLFFQIEPLPDVSVHKTYTIEIYVDYTYELRDKLGVEIRPYEN
jgi:hypothetical protein